MLMPVGAGAGAAAPARQTGAAAVPGPGMLHHFANLSQQIKQNGPRIAMVGVVLVMTGNVPAGLFGYCLLLTGLSSTPLTTFMVAAVIGTFLYMRF